MSLITRMRRQWAVYWEFLHIDMDGDDVYADPIEIKVRWEDKLERDITDKGEEFLSRSTVYVDRVMPLGGVLWKGLLVDSPPTPPEHNNIKSFREIPKLKGPEVLRIARL